MSSSISVSPFKFLFDESLLSLDDGLASFDLLASAVFLLLDACVELVLLFVEWIDVL